MLVALHLFAPCGDWSRDSSTGAPHGGRFGGARPPPTARRSGRVDVVAHRRRTRCARLALTPPLCGSNGSVTPDDVRARLRSRRGFGSMASRAIGSVMSPSGSANTTRPAGTALRRESLLEEVEAALGFGARDGEVVVGLAADAGVECQDDDGDDEPGADHAPGVAGRGAAQVGRAAVDMSVLLGSGRDGGAVGVMEHDPEAGARRRDEAGPGEGHEVRADVAGDGCADHDGHGDGERGPPRRPGQATGLQGGDTEEAQPGGQEHQRGERAGKGSGGGDRAVRA